MLFKNVVYVPDQRGCCPEDAGYSEPQSHGSMTRSSFSIWA